jgi:hypothetical protein
MIFSGHSTHKRYGLVSHYTATEPAQQTKVDRVLCRKRLTVRLGKAKHKQRAETWNSGPKRGTKIQHGDSECHANLTAGRVWTTAHGTWLLLGCHTGEIVREVPK